MEHVSKPAHVVALDGLRGIAVLLVVFAHFYGLFGLSKGGLGVDIFFVLSGYLITTTIVHELNYSGGFRFDLFVWRRALRLVPALGTVVALFSGYALLTSQTAPDLVAVHAVTAMAYAANWARAFDAWGTGPFAHTWSLAVEEQYYILWPLVCVALLQFFRAGPAVLVVTAFSFFSLGARILSATVGDAFFFYSNATHLRLDGLLMGSALAIAMYDGIRAQPRLATPVAVVGVILIALGHCPGPGVNYYLWQLSSVNLGTALVIFSVVSFTGIIARLLAVGPLVWVGQRSYGIYLIHYALFYVTIARIPKNSMTLIERQGVSLFVFLPFTLLAAWAMYKYIEKPALELKDRLRPPAAGESTAVAVG